MPDSIYKKQAELLLQMLPLVMRENVFALKGGTAINFFWRDYPRLSVDIDLTYVPIKDRNASLQEINDGMLKIEVGILKLKPTAYVQRKFEPLTRSVVSLIIRDNDVTIKVEVNYNLRGTVFGTIKKKLCKKAEDEFGLSLSVNTLSFEDIYGGKIVAALDRQHPRDLFDVKVLLDNEGLTDNIRKAFIVYLISHNRSLIEILDPGLQDIKDTFESDFVGMTTKQVELTDLLNARTELIHTIKKSLTVDEIKFLLSWKNKKPDWQLLGIDGIENLPGVKRRLMNLEKMEKNKHKEAVEKLEKYLVG
jgi:predicted nucleotidyltransferase component of viral defense system